MPNASHRKDKNMKPTIQFNEKSRRGLSDRASRQGSTFPKTDYSFQAASVANGSGRCFGPGREPFRAISQNYFKNEAPQSFAGEAALFGVIVLTVAVPIVNSVSALVHLVRSLGTL
jgi:hypothetical protein